MRRGKPKPILYMFVTCFLKGAGIGAVVFPLFVFYGSVFEYSDVATPIMVILSSVVVGIMGGAFWGAIIGVICGIIFTPFTYIAYRFRNPNTVSAVMMILIALIGGVLLIPLFTFGFMDGFLDWLLFSFVILPIILITLMLLQCTRQYFAWVQRYIREQDPRKEKRKVKNSERLAMNHVKRVSDVLDVYEESRVEQEVRKS